jgi:hypothetical protein
LFWVTIVVPGPACTSEPVPEIRLSSVNVPDRLITNVPLFTMSPTTDPLAPPLPSCSVAPEIVVPPV